MRAFLEKIEKEWMDDFVYMSNVPLLNLGVEVISYDGTDLNKFFDKYNFDIKNDIIIGSVEATVRFFEACGIEVPNYLGYPESLRPYLGRSISKCRFDEVNTPYPYFIKPATGVKLFTGVLVENEKQYKLLKEFYPIQDDTLVYISEPMKFESEYRCFVHNGELMGIQWYAGDFEVFPSSWDIRAMIKEYNDAPVAYTLDVGTVWDGRTVITRLVEVNDFWAIGSYGLKGDIYVKMAIDRMRQIGGLPTRKELNERIY